MRYTKISKRLCSERGAFLTELAMTGSVVPPNFGFAPEETAEYLDTAPDGKPRMMIKWKGNRIPIALGRMFRAGNLPETPEFASLRVGMKPWFNDDIINVYLEGLQQKLKPKNFCLLNTHYSNNEAKFEKAKYTKMLKKVGAETCQRAVILYNKDSNHWAVFYAERNGDAMRVYHYDSFTPRRQHRTYGSLKELFDDEKVVGENPKPGDPGYNFRTGANVLCELWNPEHKETDPLPATLVGFRVPQQDGFNCGVFASLTVSLLMAGNRSDFLHDVDLVAYIDGVEGRKEGREDGQKGNVSHAEAIALRMRMYVFNMLRPLAVPLREPPASDSDIEVWQEDEEPKKKGRKNGGSRIKRTRKRFFSSPRIKRTLLEGGRALQEDAAGSVARDPAALHYMAVVAPEEAAGAAEAGAALLAGLAAPPGAAAASGAAAAAGASLALLSSRHRMFYPLEKKTNGMLMGRRFL